MTDRSPGSGSPTPLENYLQRGHKPDCGCPDCIRWDVEQVRKALEGDGKRFGLSRERLANLLRRCDTTTWLEGKHRDGPAPDRDRLIEIIDATILDSMELVDGMPHAKAAWRGLLADRMLETFALRSVGPSAEPNEDPPETSFNFLVEYRDGDYGLRAQGITVGADDLAAALRKLADGFEEDAWTVVRITVSL